ncbi:hypothetical protein ALC62_15827 [Cyphomyrmex costatus]|uniref:Uncharacterized protein n=1 Tax=Cyphomyrmex costatus TaxID=456900 RepID=A0A195BXT5_9HYME|nr:hypothetical protein ALC62_15827 [Cyphomyrmex costatus]
MSELPSDGRKLGDGQGQLFILLVLQQWDSPVTSQRRCADCSRADTETPGNYKHAMPGDEEEREMEKEKEKGDGTRRRSAQPPITRCQRAAGCH